MNGEDCKRRCIEFNQENNYLMVGMSEEGIPWIDLTVPHENRPENLEHRLLMDTICSSVNDLLTEIFLSRENKEEK